MQPLDPWTGVLRLYFKLYTEQLCNYIHPPEFPSSTSEIIMLLELQGKYQMAIFILLIYPFIAQFSVKFVQHLSKGVHLMISST